jgi:hypothetical protein
MEVNAIGTLFTNNLEIDENMEVEIDSNPMTSILNIAKKLFSTTKYFSSFNFKFCTFHNKTTIVS